MKLISYKFWSEDIVDVKWLKKFFFITVESCRRDIKKATHIQSGWWVFADMRFKRLRITQLRFWHVKFNSSVYSFSFVSKSKSESHKSVLSNNSLIYTSEYMRKLDFDKMRKERNWHRFFSLFSSHYFTMALCHSCLMFVE